MISACILHKDDMCNLFRAVASVCDTVDEIVIVDSGKHDYSVIQDRFPNVTVVFYKKAFSYPDARNLAIQSAKGDWILFLDSDEELAPGQGNKLKRLVACGEFEAYSLVVCNAFRNGSWSNFPVTRLFKKHPDVYYEKEIHETINYTLAAKGIIPQITDVYIIHHGYLRDEKYSANKQLKYIALLGKQLLSTPNDSASYWHLATSYKILNQNQKAYEAINRAIQIAPMNKIPRLFLARFQIADGAYSSAISTLYQTLEIETAEYWNPAAYNLLGMVYVEQQNYFKAEKAFSSSLQTQSWSIAALLNRALCFDAIGEYKKAKFLCENLLSKLPSFSNFANANENAVTNPFKLQEDTCEVFVSRYSGSIEKFYHTILDHLH